jgi:alanine racemase
VRELLIDLDAVAANLNRMRQVAPTAKICGVVKANAYGHGMIAVARRLAAEGVDYLGVADLDEALQLRAAGIETPVLAWLHDFEEDFHAAIDANIDLGISTTGQLRRALVAAAQLGKAARVHIKVDTGLGRNGVTLAQLPELLAEAKLAQDSGDASIVGIFSHLSCTSREADLAQIENFESALVQAAEAGIHPELRHLTASDGTLSYPQAHYDMVRIGVALYGLSPYSDHSSADYGLTPAMTATARVVQVKQVGAGEGVSYGYLYRTTEPTNLALVPVGYAEGLPRLATGRAKVWLNGVLFGLDSRIAMDQFVLDVAQHAVTPGDTVVIFGDPAKGYPSADQLALAADTINYEIVTRMGGRFERVYLTGGKRIEGESGVGA